MWEMSEQCAVGSEQAFDVHASVSAAAVGPRRPTALLPVRWDP